jgi:hypothetical protein
MTRDRIKELRRVPASSLRPNPRNWRTHPPRQQAALKGILAEVGFADALLVRELKDGSLEIVDGHLRAETTPDDIVPVLVLDVSADEAAKILATHDAITGLAIPDFDQLRPLLDECDFNSPAVNAMFAQLDGLEPPEFPKPPTSKRRKRSINIVESYQVVVTCSDEAQQRAVYERLIEEGHTCRLLML